MSAATTTSETYLDVSLLPDAAQDHRSPIWWGDLMLLAIETTMFCILFSAYFYVRPNFNVWPPPRVDRAPIVFDTAPKLGFGTAVLGVLLLSVIPMVVVDRACLARRYTIAKIGLVVVIALGVAAIPLQFRTFKDLYFRWNDNAYASIVWTIIGVHILHTIYATCEALLMAIWGFAKGLDIKHARDIRTVCIYWYWVVLLWAVVYGVVFWAPRILR